MPRMTIKATFEGEEPDPLHALMALGLYDLDITVDDDE